MAESTNNKLMTEAEFNAAVRKWANSIRNEMVESASNKFAKGKSGSFSSIKDQKTHQKLTESINRKVKYDFGVADSVGFGFAKQGIYLHYGVGRGHVHTGNGVTRGRKLSSDEFSAYRKKGYRDKDIAKIKHTESGGISRQPVDWFDSKIRMGFGTLANVVQEFYGDRALEKLLNDIDRFLIKK
jgi:hypothetical protein